MKTKTLTSLLAAMLMVCSAGPAAARQAGTMTAREQVLAEATRLVNEAVELGLKKDQNEAAVRALQQALTLYRQAHAILDTYNVRQEIEAAEALLLWFRGRVSADQGNYWAAVQLLGEAVKRRPEMFEGQREKTYMAGILDRHLRSLPNNTRIVDLDDPTYILTEAISERVFFSATAEVKSLVLKAFQAAIAGDWTSVRARFQEAVNLAPGNANLQRFLALVDSPSLRATRGLQVASGTGIGGEPLPMVFDIPSLKANMNWMPTPTVLKALEDILLVFMRNAGR